MTYKIASWNVNSLRVRLPQVLHWLQANQPDILALQETKLQDDQFPVTAFTEIGYHAIFSGQRTYNGVAILSRNEARDAVFSLPNFEDAQKRFLAVSIESLRIVNVYIPNGQTVLSEKYQYKLLWLQNLIEWLNQTLASHQQVILLGDFNIAPQPIDVHDPQKWDGQVLFSAPERAAFQKILDQSLYDTFRLTHPEQQSFSWWDYRQGSFRRNFGLRIDHILVSEPLKIYCMDAGVDITTRALEQPSDHAPVWLTLAKWLT